MSSICKLCKKFIISQSITYGGGVVVINIPGKAYQNGERYCLVLAQDIPEEATINAPVFITSGTGSTRYPLENACGGQMTASQLSTRTKLTTHVVTTPTTGAFKLDCGCYYNNALESIGG